MTATTGRSGEPPRQGTYLRRACSKPLPQALDQYEFWQDESDQLRYPLVGGDAPDGSGPAAPPSSSAAADDIIYVRLGAGGHVAFSSARFDRVALADHVLTRRARWCSA